MKLKRQFLIKKNYYNKNINLIKLSLINIIETTDLVYTNIIKFAKNKFVADSIFSKNFLENDRNIIFNREVIHHLLIGSSNLTNINSANIGEQIKCIDTMKYFQQCLATLANTMNKEEKENVKMSCKKCIQRDQKLNQILLACSKLDQGWIWNICRPVKEQFLMK